MAIVDDGMRSSLNFLSYSISSINFSLNDKFDYKSVKLDYEVTSDIAFVDAETSNVKVSLLIFKDSVQNNYPFTLAIDIVGKFRIHNFDTEKDKHLLEVNAVAIMYPYIRALVSTITANANVPSLLLPPLNIINLLRNKQTISKQKG